MRTAILLAVVFVIGCKPGKQTTPAAKVWTRDEFKALVVGKTPEQVIAAVGKPNRTQEDSRHPDSPNWYYDSRTKDPVTGKSDFNVQVIFKNGIVDHINF